MNVRLDIPDIPPGLFSLLDQYRGWKSREEYVLICLQREILGDRAMIFPAKEPETQA